LPQVTLSKDKIPKGGAVGFVYEQDARKFHGLVAEKKGKYYAYQNRCMHVGVTLDLEDDDFFSEDNKHLQCSLHGAMYEVDTGECIAGPCLGASLRNLPLKEQGNELIVELPSFQEESH
jgi:nitrite reductase/ring-hydroxylating ferredoxin subunit